MLVLSLARNELVIVGHEITICVGSRNANRRKLIICAPADISVLRKELTVEQQKLKAIDFGNLVISRKAGQSVVFLVAGQEIGSMTLIKNGTRTKMGFDFHSEIEIYRQSVFVNLFTGVPEQTFSNPHLQYLLSDLA